MNNHSVCYEKVISSDPVVNKEGQLISFQDSIYLHLDINGHNVTGTYVWAPSLKRFTKGTLKGKIENNLVKVIYTYISSEGVKLKEEKFIKLEGDSAFFRVGGKMRLKDGVYVYANDQQHMQFGSAIPQKYCKH